MAPYGFRLSPFITASSGRPFDITVGRDLNGDSLFNDRPAFATELSRPSVVKTAYGIFDTNPLAGQTIIPRNYGDGPGQLTINLRLSKTFGFGEPSGSTSSGDRDLSGPPRRGGGDRGPGGPGGNRGFGGGPGGLRGIFGDGATRSRYNLTFSVSARNLLNSVNLAPPIGNLSSPLFGNSNAIASGFRSTDTANRRVEFQVRFTF